MKKIGIILASSILTIYLALFFFLTPFQIISKINDMQQTVVFSAEKSNGNLLTGYRFTNASLASGEGRRLLFLDEMKLNISLLRLLLGQIRMDIQSKEITAVLSAGFHGSMKGEANFKGIPLDSTAFIPQENILFSALLSGRMIISGRNADMEVKSDEMLWKRLSVSGFDLPLDIFENGKGALSIEQSRIIVRSLAFEGTKGYARLSGELSSGQQNLILELFPHDWNDLLLIPLERYKISPGQYKMPLNL
ncbi:MAG: hypothetical protein HZA15_05520 [Nitrospirae bacterium]|nr:hypothetical protein [Nitrospirota bacterium]